VRPHLLGSRFFSGFPSSYGIFSCAGLLIIEAFNKKKDCAANPGWQFGPEFVEAKPLSLLDYRWGSEAPRLL